MAFATVLLWVAPALATTYYIGPSGSDGTGTCVNSSSPASSTCTNINAPCATMCQCIAQMWTAGDVCVLLDGTYTNLAAFRVDSGQDCTSGSPCIIKSQTVDSDRTHGAIIVLNGGATSDWGDMRGDYWKVQGLKVRIAENRILFKVTGGGSIVFDQNRVEVDPLYGNEVFNVQGNPAITATSNWVHHWPGCVTFPDPDGAGGALDCDDGTTTTCDFTENPGAGANGMQGRIFSFDAAGGTVTFNGNNYGHWRNPAKFANITQFRASKNICTNATNHGMFELYDVQDIIVENNIMDRDTRTDTSGDATCPTGATCSCADETSSTAFFDSYCTDLAHIRNNTVVGHATGGEQLFMTFEGPADTNCTAGAGGPNIGKQFSRHYVYNNIMYDGKAGGTGCVTIDLSLLAGAQPQFLTDYNVMNACSGGFYAYTATTGTTGCNGGGDGLRCPNYALAGGNRTYWQFIDVDGNGTKQEVHGTNTAPSFVDYAGHNYHLAAGSSAIDAGVNGTVEGVSLSCPADDYEGTTRTGTCDAGAYNYSAVAASRRRQHVMVLK